LGLVFFSLKKTHLHYPSIYFFLKNLQISSTGPADIETQKYLKKKKEHAILLGGPSRYREGK
jgi:hypothetical protein